MNPAPSSEITELLQAWSAGDQDAYNRIVDTLYPELRRIARRCLSGERPQHTIQTTALVNEAYLKLLRADRIRCESRLQFLALCAKIIRRILVDHARNRLYAKRGGGAVQIPIDDELVGAPTNDVDVLALDEALATLSKLDPRKGQVVELRYFGSRNARIVISPFAGSQRGLRLPLAFSMDHAHDTAAFGVRLLSSSRAADCYSGRSRDEAQLAKVVARGSKEADLQFPVGNGNGLIEDADGLPAAN